MWMGENVFIMYLVPKCSVYLLPHSYCVAVEKSETGITTSKIVRYDYDEKRNTENIICVLY